MNLDDEIKFIFWLASKSVEFNGEADSETVQRINNHESFSPDFVIGLFNMLAGIGRERAGLVAKLGAQVEHDLRVYIEAEEVKTMEARRKGGKATGKQDQKREAYRCWQDWQANKVMYKNQDAFVLDMQNKLGVSRQSVMNWLKTWKTLTNSTNAQRLD